MKNVKVKASRVVSADFSVLTEETSKNEPRDSLRLAIFTYFLTRLFSHDLFLDREEVAESWSGISKLSIQREDDRGTQLSLTLQKSTIKLRRCSESEEGKKNLKIMTNDTQNIRTSSFVPPHELFSRLFAKMINLNELKLC